MAGAHEVIAALRGIEERVDVAVRQAVADSAHELEQSVKAQFTQSHRRGTPTPAGKGDPPAVVTGSLRRSIKVDGPRRIGFGTYVAQIGPTVVYARRQEMDPAYDHPFVKPAFDEWAATDAIQQRLRAAIAGVLK